MGKSSIEWTEQTWNPVTGCTQVSPGCANCYALTFAERFRGVPNHVYTMGFDLTLRPERLAIPLNRKQPTTYFVNSMSDLFHEAIPLDYIKRVFDVMNRAPQHIFQVLTKRHERLAEIAQIGGVTWTPNIWQGVSIENDRFTLRADYLRRVPATVRFLSCEPLLTDLPSLDITGLHWVIAGAESGHGARTMHHDWVRHLRDLCVAKDVRFFYKQDAAKGHKIPLPELDGRVWDEMPVTTQHQFALFT